MTGLHLSALIRLGFSISALTVMAGCAGDEPTGTAARLQQAAAERPEVSLSASGGAGTDAVRGALMRHPAIEEAANEIAASAAEVRVSRAALFPQLGLGATTGLTTDDDDDDNDPALELTGSQVITDFGTTALSIDAADLDVLRNYVAFQQAVDDAAVETLTLMADVQRARALVPLRTEQLGAMRDLQGLVQQRRAAGATSEPDILETERRIQSAEFALFEAELAEAEAESALIEVSGIPFSGKMPSAPSGRGCRSGNLPDTSIQIARLDEAIAELTLEKTKRSHLPRIALEAVARQPTEGSARIGMNVNIDTRVFEGGARSARLDAAARSLQARKSGVARARQSDQLEQLRLTRELSAASQRQQMIGRQIGLLDEARELYRRQYFDLGTRDLVDLLDTEEDFFDLQADQIVSRHDEIALRWQCASRSNNLLPALGITEASLHGFPLQLK